MPLFDPARDGFGFRNPAGRLPSRSGGNFLSRWFDAFIYGDGLCFGMAALALERFTHGAVEPPLAGLSPAPGLLDSVRRWHGRQVRLRAVLAVILGWLRDRGGRPGDALRRLRLPGSSADPHVLCFGPAGLNRGFFRRLTRAHAVVPYRFEGNRLYVYDPNHPKDRGRRVVLRRDGSGRVTGYEYEGFSSEQGWGLALLPLSAVTSVSRRVR